MQTITRTLEAYNVYSDNKYLDIDKNDSSNLDDSLKEFRTSINNHSINNDELMNQCKNLKVDHFVNKGELMNQCKILENDHFVDNDETMNENEPLHEMKMSTIFAYSNEDFSFD